MHKKVRVKDVRHNPFRDMKRYPINAKKVATLLASYESTGFWGNIVGRKNGDGGYEIAYGHHRLMALRDHLKPNDTIDLIVRDLDDDKMLQIMANENMEEWGTSALVTQETVRAVILAFAEGKITLPPVHKNSKGLTSLRFAPSFIRHRMGAVSGVPEKADKPYNASTIAEYLNWDIKRGKGKKASHRGARPNERVRMALRSLELQEIGILKTNDFNGLTTAEALALTDEAFRTYDSRNSRVIAARKTCTGIRELHSNATKPEVKAKHLAALKKATEELKKARADSIKNARQVVRAIVKKLGKGEITVEGVRRTALAVRADPRAELPHITKFARKLAGEIHGMFNDDTKQERTEALIKFRGDIDKDVVKDLAEELRLLGVRARGLKNKLLA